jgi:hypothetical protein
VLNLEDIFSNGTYAPKGFQNKTTILFFNLLTKRSKLIFFKFQEKKIRYFERWLYKEEYIYLLEIAIQSLNMIIFDGCLIITSCSFFDCFM